MSWVLWALLLLQRVSELRLAKKNAHWMSQQGGYEVGRDHYPLIVFLHGIWFFGVLLEGSRTQSPDWWFVPFLLFLCAQSLRYWCISSLGTYWNTRIWIVPGHSLRKKGPYRYLRHPNYWAVIVEIFTFPLIFGAYITSIVMTLIHTMVLYFIRIPEEEKALQIAQES